MPIGYWKFTSLRQIWRVGNTAVIVSNGDTIVSISVIVSQSAGGIVDNEGKHKYELLEAENMKELYLTSPGKYLITEEEYKEERMTPGYLVVAVGGFTVIAGAAYVMVRKRHWFW